jgi:hypothetical protein
MASLLLGDRNTSPLEPLSQSWILRNSRLEQGRIEPDQVITKLSLSASFFPLFKQNDRRLIHVKLPRCESFIVKSSDVESNVVLNSSLR